MNWWEFLVWSYLVGWLLGARVMTVGMLEIRRLDERAGTKNLPPPWVVGLAGVAASVLWWRVPLSYLFAGPAAIRQETLVEWTKRRGKRG